MLSPRVARALRELGINASHVGNEVDGAPPRGSSDPTVLDYALQTNQVIVTSNHDMIYICAERQASVIWLDPRGRQFRRTEQVALVFGRISEWQAMLAGADGPVCLHVLRTKTEVLALDRAQHLVTQRMRRLRVRKRAKTKQQPPSPPLPDFPEVSR